MADKIKTNEVIDMSYYLFYELETEEKGRVFGINTNPTGSLTEDQKAQAIVVDELPPEEYKSGKYVEFYVNPRTKEVWIEYKDRELTPQEEIDQLKQQNSELMFAVAELASANEKDKMETQLAIAELASIMTGGIE